MCLNIGDGHLDLPHTCLAHKSESLCSHRQRLSGPGSMGNAACGIPFPGPPKRKPSGQKPAAPPEKNEGEGNSAGVPSCKSHSPNPDLCKGPWGACGELSLPSRVWEEGTMPSGGPCELGHQDGSAVHRVGFLGDSRGRTELKPSASHEPSVLDWLWLSKIG